MASEIIKCQWKSHIWVNWNDHDEISSLVLQVNRDNFGKRIGKQIYVRKKFFFSSLIGYFGWGNEREKPFRNWTRLHGRIKAHVGPVARVMRCWHNAAKESKQYVTSWRNVTSRFRARQSKISLPREIFFSYTLSLFLACFTVSLSIS